MARGDALILTGFMGVGKSTVGARVAERLGRPFVDLDAEVESRAGKTLSAIFAEDGEASFRELERTLCRELSQRDGGVIATGGGTLVDPQNRDALVECGTVVCLTCRRDELLRRLAAETGRPLLDGGDPAAAIDELMAKRGATYDALPWHVDTASRPIDEIVNDVLDLVAARRLTVRHPDGAYAIDLGPGLRRHLGDAVRAAGRTASGAAVLVVSNDVVFPLYGASAVASLADAGYDVATWIVPDGERHKTLETARVVYDALAKGGLDRRGTVVALGGGVVGDLAGYAAATYLRGVGFFQVPTTLLAMVDASVGGKTGIDLPAGKNLVGAFKQPDGVLIDPHMLDTLPDEEVRSGLAEMIKHGVIGDPGLVTGWTNETGRGDAMDRMVEFIERSLRVKIGVVEEDPFERGRRAVLNLGHTLGHAVEAVGGYRGRHGEAVAVGLVAAARIAVRVGIAPAVLVVEMEDALSRVGLPVRCPPFDVGELLAAMEHDKKRVGREPRWVLPRAVGDVVPGCAVPCEVVREVITEMGARRAR